MSIQTIEKGGRQANVNLQYAHINVAKERKFVEISLEMVWL